MATQPVPQTPKRPRQAPPTPVSPSRRLHGTRETLPNGLDNVETLRHAMKRSLGLDFTPDLWQAHVVQRVLRGFDCVVVAATGLGKSLIFEGTAALAERGKVVIVVCPLKALEHDQVDQAASKGLDAVALNEDTEKTADTWEHIRSSAQLVYMSPEMVKGTAFAEKLWKDKRFRSRVAAFIVDEAHCVDEWGEDDFRPQYRELGPLRKLLGMDVPFCAVTATCRTSTFNVLWRTLLFGKRPFWGIDVGADRRNLFFHTRVLKNPDHPNLDALNILPESFSDDSHPRDLPKCLFYFDSQAACRDAVDTLRKVFPKHLRSCVYTFTSMVTEKSKQRCWEGLGDGTIRIVCATDAAGMGCNISDIDYAVVFGEPSSLGVLLQRWGRAGRARLSVGTCLLFVRHWAVRPELRSPPPAPAAGKAKAKVVEKKEPKREAESRAKLDPLLEGFLNTRALPGSKCLHAYVHRHFRPDTQLDTLQSLDNPTITQRGKRSRSSAFQLTWTVLDLARAPPPERCCGVCNPAKTTRYESADEHDERIFAFTTDFAFPILPRPRSPRAEGPAFEAFPRDFTVAAVDVDRLRGRLVRWREDTYVGDLDPAILLPPKQLKLLLDAASRLLGFAYLTVDTVLSVVCLDTASRAEIRGIAACIDVWRLTVPRPLPVPPTPTVLQTPASQRRPSKRKKKENEENEMPRATMPQPVFATPQATPGPSRGLTDMLPPPLPALVAAPALRKGKATAPTVSSRAKATSRAKPALLPTPPSSSRPAIPPSTPLTSRSDHRAITTPSPTPNAAYYRVHTFNIPSSSPANPPSTATYNPRYYKH